MEQIKPDKRYLLAQPQDLNINIGLKSNFNDVNDFNNTRIISLSELFVKERDESIKYRIYGNINYVSFLRNKKTTTNTITDLFNDDFNNNNGFNLENFFDLKLFRLDDIQQSYTNVSSAYTETLIPITGDANYKLSFFGLSKNIYGERIYNFKFDTQLLNPTKLVKLNNDLFYDNNVYLGFIPKNNLTVYEKIFTTFDYSNSLHPNTLFGYNESDLTTSIINSIVSTSNIPYNFFVNNLLEKLKYFLSSFKIKVTQQNIDLNMRFIRNYLNLGNQDYKDNIPYNFNRTKFEGNLMHFDRENYTFNEIIKKEYLIKIQLVDNYTGPTNMLQSYINKYYINYDYTLSNTTIKVDFLFKFNPFHKIELKQYSDFIEEVDINMINTDTILADNKIIYENKYIWRELLSYNDPNAKDLPFINNTHYYYNDINFFLKPDLSDYNTNVLINDLNFKFTTGKFIIDKQDFKLKQEKPKIC